jgi:hypothetical protein
MNTLCEYLQYFQLLNRPNHRHNNRLASELQDATPSLYVDEDGRCKLIDEVLR